MVNKSLGLKNLDTWYHKNSIQKFIESQLYQLNGIVLDAGCGNMPYKKFILTHSNTKQYIGLDIEEARIYGDIKPDIFWKDGCIPLENKTVDSILSTEVIEHVFELEPYLKECNRVLKIKGTIILTTPFLWPLHEAPYDAHRLSPWSIEKHLEKTGFQNVNVVPLGGWNASMAQMLGLWVKRSGMNKLIQFIMTILLYPLCFLLIKFDKKPKSFTESSMITGYGIIASRTT